MNINRIKIKFMVCSKDPDNINIKMDDDRMDRWNNE